MDNPDIDDTSLENEEGYHSDATGYSDALAGMGRQPRGSKASDSRTAAGNTLRGAEKSAANKKVPVGGPKAMAAEAIKSGIANKVKGRGAASKSKGKGLVGSGKGKKALALVLIVAVLLVGAAYFLSQAGQMIGLVEQIPLARVAVASKSAERETQAWLRSTDPNYKFSDRMLEILNQFGFTYYETDNGDGTVAKALIYSGKDESDTMIASSSLRDKLVGTLSATGSIVSNFRDLATVSEFNDEVAAAWTGAHSVVGLASNYSQGAQEVYSRLDTSGTLFNNDPANPSNSEVYDSLKSGSASEDINAVSGTTLRYTWHTHEYEVCTSRSPRTGECLSSYPSSCSDWDSVSPVRGMYDAPDPYPDYTTVCEGDATPEAFQLETQITSDDDQSTVGTNISNRAILAAFSTDPTYRDKQSSETVDQLKSDDSVIAAVSSMVKNKTLNFAHGLLVSVGKTKAGDGGMEMNYYGNLLNTPADSFDAKGNFVSTMAATESKSFNSWFSDDVIVDPNDPLVQKYNIAKSMSEVSAGDISYNAIMNDQEGNYNRIENIATNNSRITENMSNTNDYYYCEKSAGSMGNLCPDGHIELNPSNYQVTDDVAAAVYAMTSIDLKKDPGGEEAGVALNEGISLLNDALLMQISMTYGDETSTAAFYQFYQNYQEELANYDRHTKSPFDASSKNTFLGSIVSSLIPFATATSHNTIFTTLSSAARVVGSSVSALLPSASAISTLDNLQANITNDCVAYDVSGMVCNIYGNQASVMELGLMNSAHPMSSVQDEMVAGGYITCDSDDKCEVVDKEDNKYASALKCNANSGLVNTSQNVDKNAGKVSWGQSILNFLKRLFFGTEVNSENLAVCGGKYASAKLTRDEMTLFAQFNADQEVKTILGDLETTTASRYLEKYYEESPLDNSYKGIIARSAGLTVDELDQIFAQMEYAVYIARYNPAERYQFVEALPDNEISVESHLGDNLATAAIVGKLQDFEELRNRNFAA